MTADNKVTMSQLITRECIKDFVKSTEKCLKSA